MKKFGLLTLAFAAMCLICGHVFAAAYFQCHFSEGEGYTVGDINGQNGW